MYVILRQTSLTAASVLLSRVAIFASVHERTYSLAVPSALARALREGGEVLAFSVLHDVRSFPKSFLYVSGLPSNAKRNRFRSDGQSSRAFFASAHILYAA